ncbi:hypothetical protein M0R88_08025 [Halorussus gelatinilyticus]|uniref:Uncharacterized protein n=1 Tax=Halorussus gelatinilyticus TaxID=2937524 RepID=A0A8U0ILM3_9EURY|nr:hypothetical protein [Halorussus gelatinilyticus]UPW02030.1 hypothetical protein M0R88_08025 [Halorussus gelatinilyticus]
MTGADIDSPTEITDTIEKPDRGPVGEALFDFKRWFLIDANRWLVVGVLAVGTFGLTVLVGTFGPVSVQQFLAKGISPAAALVELLKTIVSVTTIVLSINQLVLSPELGPVSDQRERLDDTMKLRRQSEGLLDETVSPLSPGQYLDDLVSALRDRARSLEEDVTGSPELESDVATFSRKLVADAENVNAELQDAKFGDFEAVAAVMDFDTSGKIRRLRRIRKEYSEQLDGDETEALVEMINALELFVTARGYLKTTYIRTEFINFSRALLYVGLPSLLVAFWASQMYDPTIFPGETLGVENRLWFVSAAATTALVPFATLISYISRLATVSQSTLFIGPFVAGSEHHEE